MSTIYRAVFSDERPDLIGAAHIMFVRWLAAKGVAVQVPASGRAEDSRETAAVEVNRAEAGDVEAVRLRLDEETAGQRWSTILTAMVGPEEGWVWIDLERVSDDAYGPPPVLAPPGLVRAFLESSTCRAGSTVLRAQYRKINEENVGDLLEELLDPGRIVPVIVASRDTQTQRRPVPGRGRWRPR